RPGHVLATRPERHSDTVHAGHNPAALIDLRVNWQADARHDPHVDHNIGRVCKLDANLRHGRADWTHAERQHVHGPAAHAAAEDLLQLLAHFEGIHPVVGGAGAIF